MHINMSLSPNIGLNLSLTLKMILNSDSEIPHLVCKLREATKQGFSRVIHYCQAFLGAAPNQVEVYGDIDHPHTKHAFVTLYA